MAGLTFTPRPSLTAYVQAGACLRAAVEPGGGGAGARAQPAARGGAEGAAPRRPRVRHPVRVSPRAERHRDPRRDRESRGRTATSARRGSRSSCSAEPTASWFAAASYAFTDAELTRFSEAVAGFDPTARHGGGPLRQRAAPSRRGTPGALWTVKRFGAGVGLGGGARYVGEQFIAEDNAFAIDSYLTVDAMASYRVRRRHAQRELQEHHRPRVRDARLRPHGGHPRRSLRGVRHARRVLRPVTAAPAGLEARASAARSALDAWTREVVAWHFDPATGTPFWLDWAARAGWDPRREVKGYADLDRFGSFEDEWLRGGPVRRWVPRATPTSRSTSSRPAAAPACRSPASTSTTSGIDYEAFSDTLPDESFPQGRGLAGGGPERPAPAAPGGGAPRQHRGGICFMVDLDPRWVIKLIKAGELGGGGGLQAARGRAGAHPAARARHHPLPVHHPQAARGAVREDLAQEGGHHRRLLRRHRDDPAVPPLRGGGAAGGGGLRPHLRQHAHGPGRHTSRGPARRRLRHHLLPAGAAGHDRGRGSRPPGARWWTTARPGACA